MEASEIHLPLTELELNRVGDNACLAHCVQKVNCPPPVSLKLVIMVQYVIDTSFLSQEIGPNPVKSFIVPVPR